MKMNDGTKMAGIGDLETARTHQRLKELREKLLDGTLECSAIRLYWKDGTSLLVVVGGSAEEQVAVRAQLEGKEAELQALKTECHPAAAKIFAHLPQDERLRVLDTPERLKVALNTLSEIQLTQVCTDCQNRLARYLILLEGVF